MAKGKILIVDDERDILEILKFQLVREGFEVTCAESGEEALAKARRDLPDLLILDLMLPGLDGMDVARELRSDPSTARIPIVMLTAKGEEADIVSGLELGAEDYVVKPFSPKVLIARVRNVLRRRAGHFPVDEGTVAVEELTLHPGRHEAEVAGRSVNLTPTEFRILLLLARRPGWTFTRNQIIEAVHGDDYAVTDRAVDVHITSLRSKLGPFGRKIETVRGIGYRLKDPRD